MTNVEKDVRTYLDKLQFTFPITRVEHDYHDEYSVYVRRVDGEERLIGTWDARRKEFV